MVINLETKNSQSKQKIKHKKHLNCLYIEAFFKQLLKAIICALIIIGITILFTGAEIVEYVICQQESFITFLNIIQGFLEVAVAIYSAVISIFATAKTTVTEKLSKNNSHISFIVTISVGFIANIIAVYLNVLVTSFGANGILILAAMILTLISICYMIIFLAALIKIFALCAENSAKEAQEEEAKYNSIQTTLEKIERKLK